MSDFSNEEWQAAGLVGMGIAHGLLVVMREKGLLTAAQANDFLDHVLIGLEQKFSADEPVVQHARKIVETLFRER